MRRDLLPNWPEEVLVEWFHRHKYHLEDYAFLKYERFSFERVTFQTNDVPGLEAFLDPLFCQNPLDITQRAEMGSWLAQYMLKNGTWNTPIILPKNEQQELRSPAGKQLGSPYHLLEGHNRLCFLIGMRERETAIDKHDVWLVTIDSISD